MQPQSSMRLMIVVAGLFGGIITPAYAGAKGNIYGWVKAEIVADRECPIEPKRVGIQDNNSQSMAGQAFTGPNVGEGGGFRGDVRYDFSFRTKVEGITAIEIVYEGLSAFNELSGEKKISFSFKSPLRADQTKYESQAEERIFGDVAKYRVRVTRVAFADGHIWTAAPSAATQ